MMSNRRFVSIALSFACLFSGATASASRIMYMDDPRYINNPYRAENSFVKERYWEPNSSSTWFTAWVEPWGYSHIPGYGTNPGHLHLHFQGNSECADTSLPNWPSGEFVNGVCQQLDPLLNRGPIQPGHNYSNYMYVQEIAQSGAREDFHLESMDLCNDEADRTDVWVRGVNGIWYYWSGLRGWGSGDLTKCRRWSFGQAPVKVDTVFLVPTPNDDPENKVIVGRMVVDG